MILKVRSTITYQYGISVMRPKIILMQSSHNGHMLCREELEKMGLKMDIDFYIFDSEVCVHSQWEAGQRQLFMTGTFSGNEEGVAEMVQKARECNPELVCMSFALNPIPGPFDYAIEKSRDSLVAAVQGFLDGTLNRTDVRWTPPAPKKEHWPWAL